MGITDDWDEDEPLVPKRERNYWRTFGVEAPAEDEEKNGEPLPPPPEIRNPAPKDEKKEHHYQLIIDYASAALEWPPEPREPQRRIHPGNHPARDTVQLGLAVETRRSDAQLPLEPERTWHSWAEPGYQRLIHEIPKRQFERTEALCFWCGAKGGAEGETALYADAAGADAVAKGVLRVTDFTERTRRQERRAKPTRVTHVKRCKVVVVDGVAAFTARQMRQNARSAAVAKLREANDEAERLYESKVARAVSELDGVERFHCATADTHSRALQEAIDWKADVRREYSLSDLQNRIRGLPPFGLTEAEAEESAEALEAYHALRSTAFFMWGKLVRTEPFVQHDAGDLLSADVLSALEDFTAWPFEEALSSMYGTGAWDFKPVIYKAWGAWNRLGNSPAVYYYDIWANLHYGYVGGAAGFSERELLWGSTAQQQADSGADDTNRDKEAVSEGFELQEQHPLAVVTGHLTGICDAHRPQDYERETGWGYLDYGAAGGTQKKISERER